jgi:nitronate monooxygenase
MLGADGVLVGSRFWASAESLAPERLQTAAIAADGDSTLRTTIVDIARGIEWPKPFTARTLKTRFAMDWHGREGELAEPETLAREEARYRQAAQAGDAENTCVLTGEAIGLIRDVAPARVVLERMVGEAEALMTRHGRVSR